MTHIVLEIFEYLQIYKIQLLLFILYFCKKKY